MLLTIPVSTLTLSSVSLHFLPHMAFGLLPFGLLSSFLSRLIKGHTAVLLQTGLGFIDSGSLCLRVACEWCPQVLSFSDLFFI